MCFGTRICIKHKWGTILFQEMTASIISGYYNYFGREFIFSSYENVHKRDRTARSLLGHVYISPWETKLFAWNQSSFSESARPLASHSQSGRNPNPSSQISFSSVCFPPFPFYNLIKATAYSSWRNNYSSHSQTGPLHFPQQSQKHGLKKQTCCHSHASILLIRSDFSSTKEIRICSTQPARGGLSKDTSITLMKLCAPAMLVFSQVLKQVDDVYHRALPCRVPSDWRQCPLLFIS